MNYKVLCSDLDGTLLSTKNDVSQFTIQQIKRIRHAIRIVLVSARMPSSMYYLQERLGIENEPIICYNGALIINAKKEVLSVTIPAEVLWKVYEICKSLDVDLGVYIDDSWFVPKTSDRVQKEIHHTKTEPIFEPTSYTLTHLKQRGAHKVMLMCKKDSADELMPQLKNRFERDLNIYRSNSTLIEIGPKSVSKRTAIEHILLPGQNLNDIIAFGDNYNDIEMMQAAGCSVAVANARTEVKAIADQITLANTDHGVADFIQQHLVI